MASSTKSSRVEEGDESASLAVADAKLLRKVDLRLLPILTLLYLSSFLDRSNIGNARIVGLADDIHLSPPAYNTALALYFVAYVIFEVPANIILKRFDPQIWLPTLTLAWGIASVGQGLITNQAGLFGIRFLLGVTEAGLFPGVIFLFSVYYRRRERSWRVAIFFGGAALAGAFGGACLVFAILSPSIPTSVRNVKISILAFALGKMDGIGGRRGWAWIFIMEGVLTIAVSLASYFIVPTWSYKAKFLTEEERARLLARLSEDSDAGKREQFDWAYVRQAFTDRFVWGYAMLFHGFAFVLYSLSLFMPSIIAGLGFKSWEAQLMTVPPNALASVSIWLTVWASSKYNLRAPFIIGAALVAILGYIILLTATTAAGQYVGVHFAAVGVYVGNALLLSWPGENVSGQTKRAVAVAMQITIGDTGAIAGVLIYRPNFAAHRYRKPHIIAIGYLLFAIAVTLYLWTSMARENKRRDAIVRPKSKEGSGDSEVDDEEDRLRQGDRHVDYRYVL